MRVFRLSMSLCTFACAITVASAQHSVSENGHHRITPYEEYLYSLAAAPKFTDMELQEYQEGRRNLEDTFTTIKFHYLVLLHKEWNFYEWGRTNRAALDPETFVVWNKTAVEMAGKGRPTGKDIVLPTIDAIQKAIVAKARDAGVSLANSSEDTTTLRTNGSDVAALHTSQEGNFSAQGIHPRDRNIIWIWLLVGICMFGAVFAVWLFRHRLR